MPTERSPRRAAATSAKLPKSRVAILLVGFAALLACLAVFGAIAQDVHSQEAIALDAIMTPLLHSYASPQLDAVMWAITTLGSTLVVAPLFVVAEVALLRVRRRREALFLAIALIGSVIMNGLLKLVFQRPRPQLPWAQTPLDYSFPSGHTMNSLVFYLALALIAWVIWGPRVGIPATIGGDRPGGPHRDQPDLSRGALLQRRGRRVHRRARLAAHRVGRVRRRAPGSRDWRSARPRRTRRRSPRSDVTGGRSRATASTVSAGARSPSGPAAGPTP